VTATARDEVFMRAALALARRGLGRTAPNPSVAALIVDESRDPPVMLARGLTAPRGRPHAEALAIRKAGAAARGATLYVTLEPCARRSVRNDGPSCTEQILESGIARVVIGAADPSPFAAGEGAMRLRAAGVEVVEGVLAEEAGRLNQGHCQRVRLGRPFVRVKLAQTADGFAGTTDRKPLVITGEAARARVHRLRSDVEALITGIGTVLADDPLLDVRLPGMAEFSPLRVILDTEGRIRPDLRIIADAARIPVLIATAAPEAVRARLGERAAVEVMAVPRGNSGLDLAAMFGALGARGITRVMVEAGPTLANAVAKAGFCDELVLLDGPEKSGDGLPAIGPDLAEWIAKADLRTEERLASPSGSDRLRLYTRGI
jgi:diaminohydroxyphosphoribosylaminopyrimidine deaminase / 5-amino-6-(5-phosphoribosylamino)uracil reductase